MRAPANESLVSRRAALLVALVVVLGSLASEPRSASASHGCSVRGKTLLRTSEARIFERRRIPRDADSDPNYFGCFNRKGSTFRLNLDDDFGNLAERFRLSGRYAGIVQSFGSEAGSDTERVVVTDLVSGRRLYFGPRLSPSYDPGGLIGALLLKRNGAVAFINPGSVVTRSLSGAPVRTDTVRIYTVTAAGERVVAQDPGIRTGALRLSRDRRSLVYIDSSHASWPEKLDRIEGDWAVTAGA